MSVHEIPRIDLYKICSPGQPMRRRMFWPLIAIGSLLVAAAAASVTAAFFSIELPRSVSFYGYTDVFGRATSLNWSADWGFLLAAAVCAVVGLVIYAVAAHSR
jgi:hypothetical protein